MFTFTIPAFILLLFICALCGALVGIWYVLVKWK